MKLLLSLAVSISAFYFSLISEKAKFTYKIILEGTRLRLMVIP